MYGEWKERTLKHYIFFCDFFLLFSSRDSGFGIKKSRKCRQRRGETQKQIDGKRLDPPERDLYKTMTIIGLLHKTHKNQYYDYILHKFEFQKKKKNPNSEMIMLLKC